MKKCKVKEIKYTTLSVITYVIPFYYGFGTVNNYGSGSAKVRN